MTLGGNNLNAVEGTDFVEVRLKSRNYKDELQIIALSDYMKHEDVQKVSEIRIKQNGVVVRRTTNKT